MIKLKKIDHFVLTVNNIEKTIEFYTSILGCEKVIFKENRVALKFGDQKINLHPSQNPIKPHAIKPTPGSCDICFIVENNLIEVKKFLTKKELEFEGPVERTGSNGAIQSIYIRDPDQNLVELSNYK